MPWTHDYELEFDADHKYAGQLELTSSGTLEYKSDSDLEAMAGQMEDELKAIFDKLGQLYAAYGKLKKFEVTKKQLS